MEPALINSSARLRAIAPPSENSIATSTALVMGATVCSLISGFGREVVNARFYGARWEMDTFLAAATIPAILFGIFNGALVSALVPLFSEYFSTGREREGRVFANTIVTCLAIILPIASLVGYIFAPLYVPLIAHGFPPQQIAVAVRMTRWLLPSLVATSLSGVFTALLNANHRFFGASLQGIAINVTTIVTVLALNGRMGIYAVVLGTALGLCAQLAVVLPSVAQLGGYRPELDLRHPGMQRLWLMVGPILVGSAAGQLALFFDRFFASTLSSGYIAGMNYAQKLVGVPQQVFAAAIATVIFPLFATHFASRNRAALRQSVTMGLRMVGFITIPSICGLIVLATPLISVLFERGSFGPTPIPK